MAQAKQRRDAYKVAIGDYVILRVRDENLVARIGWPTDASDERETLPVFVPENEQNTTRSGGEIPEVRIVRDPKRGVYRVEMEAKAVFWGDKAVISNSLPDPPAPPDTSPASAPSAAPPDTSPDSAPSAPPRESDPDPSDPSWSSWSSWSPGSSAAPREGVADDPATLAGVVNDAQAIVEPARRLLRSVIRLIVAGGKL